MDKTAYIYSPNRIECALLPATDCTPTMTQANMTVTQAQLKQAAAQAALDWILPQIAPDAILGIGTGSTANCFIDRLADHKSRFAATVASSNASAERLRALGIEVLDLNSVDRIAFYVDGADEATADLSLIKGGGAALTREKIVAAVAQTFVCIADDSKLVPVLGQFPLPVEVIPMARRHVMAELTRLGGHPVHRAGVVTDNGCDIVDVHQLRIHNPAELEQRINNIVGVVTNGLFAARGADVLLLAGAQGVKTLTR